MMNRKLIYTTCTIATLSIVSSIDAWTPIVTLHRIRSASNYSPTMLLSKTGSKHPGFQDCYDSDDDCLSTTYSAAFVAEEWIKSMPCGKDADCLPEELSHPGTMKDSVSGGVLSIVIV